MKRLCTCSLFLLCCSGLGLGGAGTPTGYEAAYAQLMNLAADPGHGAPVAHLVLKRDAGTFTLEEGSLFLCTPVLNRTCAVAFYGKGTFSFEPPLSVEREQLRRFYETPSLHEPFTFMMIIFTDSTLREIYHKCAFQQLSDPGVGKKIRSGLSYMGKSEGENFDPEIIKSLLEFQSNTLFWAFLETKNRGDLFFEINPFAEEEVTLGRRADVAHVYGDWREIVSRFHLQECYASGNLYHRSDREFLRTEKYAIESKFGDDLDFSARADVQFYSLKENQEWLYFSLSGLLEVDSVFLEGKGRIPFFKGSSSPYLWVNFDPPLAQGQPATLRVYYHGDLVYKDEELALIALRSPDGWYPRYDWQNSQMYDLTYHIPSRMKFSSVGKRVAASTADGVETSRWVTEHPIRNASFNLGYFKEYEIAGDTVPAITVQRSDYSHHVLSKGGLLPSGTGMEEDVGADVTESLRFYQHLFGRCGAGHLYATEIPQEHGEAFEGLIHLAWSTFQYRQENGFDEIFRAHEVAHQWWGIGLNFKTYHDQWLSEAFANYCGLWYMQIVLHDNGKFFDMLKGWKGDILSARKFLLGSGQESGPVWLGYRTQSTSTEGDYDLVIYKKGAWILHMLRMMLLDLNTMNEDRFERILRSFYAAYAGKSASTADFEEAVEREMGIDMQWFFKQWIYETRIPKYAFSYKLAGLDSLRRYKVTCRVEQSGVSEDFRMPVLLYVDFGDNKYARLRVIVQGPSSQFDLPSLPLEPKKIVFNDMESVLCEVDYAGWK
jgi:hypothetical protein